MSLARIVLFVLLLSCGMKENQRSEKGFQTYLAGLFLQTSFLECGKNKFEDHSDFEDPASDVKIGFLRVSPENLNIHDLPGGSIQNQSDYLKLKLKFASVPEILNIDFPPANSENMDLQIDFHFFLPDKISIGIFHYSTGAKKPVFWDHFNVQVFEQNQELGTCGKPIKTSSTLEFSCEKSLLPVLKKLNNSHSFNVSVVYRDEANTYQDCY